MRIITVALSVVLIAAALLAEPVPPPPVKPAKQGQSVEDALNYINQHVYISQDFSDTTCRDRIQVSLSDDRQEILVKYLLVDRHDKIRDERAPKYIYHVPVAAVERIYIWGPKSANDRVVVRTLDRAVQKFGPVWDCNHSILNDKPKKKRLGSVDLLGEDPDKGHLNDVAKAFQHVVDLLQAEQEAKAAAQPTESHDSNNKETDTSTDHK